MWLVWGLLAVGAVLGLAYAGFRIWLSWTMRFVLRDKNVSGLLADGEQLKAELEGGEFSGLIHELQAASGDWSRVYRVYDLLCSAKALPKLASWCEKKPRNPTAHLASGVAALDAAWQARTGRQAKDVAERDWEAFDVLTGEARRGLERAAKLDPDDPTPWAFLVNVAMCESDRGAVLHCLAEANRRDPGHYFAHDNAMFALTEKWLGSHRTSLDLVRKAAADLPLGAPLHGLVIAAHLNVWQYYAFFENDQDKALRYLRREKVQRECDRALERSVDHPDHVECEASNQVQNCAAFYYFLIEDHDAARERFHRIGERWTIAPWGWGPGLSAGGSFRDARSLAEP